MSSNKSFTVLLVEDDKDIRESMLELLESEGYTVVASSNGQEAIDYLDKSSELPGMILLDMMMPIKDGFQFRSEQRQNPRLTKIPVVVMSADGSIQKKLDDLSVSVYLKKPLDIDSLLSVVEKIRGEN